MKTIKYIAKNAAILLFSLILVQSSFAQRNGRGDRSRYERGHFNSTNHYNSGYSFNRPPFYGSNAYPNFSPYGRNNYSYSNHYNNYNSPLIVNSYYYGGGYHPYPSYYRPFSRSLFGISINILPRGYYPFYVGRNRYFYNDGLYYQPYQGYYQTIAPPLGALVPSLPTGASAVNINNQNYYEFNGTYYQHLLNGPSRYEVVGVNGILKTDVVADSNNDNNDYDAANNNQPITSLPEKFKTVVLDNKVYYVTPAGEYYTKNIDAKGVTTYKIEAK